MDGLIDRLPGEWMNTSYRNRKMERERVNGYKIKNGKHETPNLHYFQRDVGIMLIELFYSVTRRDPYHVKCCR